MSAIQKKKKINPKELYGVIDPKVGNYGKHPFFIQKANEAKAFLKSAGLPKKLTKAK